MDTTNLLNVIRVQFLGQFCQFIRCYKYVVYKEANKMTEEFNESMINDIKEGDKVTGEVQQVEDKQVVVHINGGKFNGIIPISQLSTHHIDSPSEVVKEGDEVEAYVTKVEFDEENETGAYILSRRQLETEKSYSYLQEKLDNNEIIEAKVNRSS